MGSSRASVLGEATINLADYVDASKPIVEAFPLHGCNFGTVLHITIQLLTSKTGFREFEQQRELREKGLESGVDQYGVVNDQTDEARTKFKADASELSSLEEEAIDGSSNTSGSLYAEKHETSFTNELDGVNCTISGGLNELSPHRSSNSMDHELATACLVNGQLRGSLESAESSLFNLKLEVSSLQGVADELSAETQKLSHELAAEMSSAEELTNEVLFMKSECVKFKDDIARLKDSKLTPRTPLVEARDDQVDRVVRDMRLQFSNGISVVEGKIRELQKTTYVVPHDGDTKFIHQELETLLDFLNDFKLGNDEVTTKIRETSQFESGNVFGLDLCPPESVLQHFSLSPPVSDVVSPIDAMKTQIFDLVRELDEAKVEKEGLTQKMDQMELYYEALIHELEVSQKRLLGELQLLRNDHTTCLYALSASKTEAESLREETNQQMLQFLNERRCLEAGNEELERRAISSEAALRRARLNYSIAVDKLQKDLELLSSQVTSMFEANENLIKQALPSQPDPRVEEDDATKFAQNQNSGLGRTSVSMQEDLYRKVEEELVEMHSINLNLDIYSKALEQSLREKTSELVEELKSSTASQNHLMLRLQKATDEINELHEFKSSSISQCSEMALQNQLLEDKLVSVLEENCLLAEKLIDRESTLSELRNCQSKYVACLAENTELSLQLKQEAFENEKLKAEFDEQKADLERKVRDLSLSSSKDEQQRAELVRVRELASRLELEKSKLGHLVEELEKNSSCQASLECQLSDMHDYTLAADVKLVYISNKYETVLEELQRLASSDALLRDLQERFHDMESMLSHSRAGESDWRRERDSLLGSLKSLRSNLEQCETKNEELKQLLSMSKKDGEEMLVRLRDAIDEIENRKKSEAVSLKRNEELSTRLSALEAELLSVIIEKREKSNAYGRTKAEMERALLSLECCKEENEKLAASLLEFEAQKSHLVNELASMKGQLEDLKSSTGNLQTFREAAPHVQINGETSDANDEHLGAQRLKSSIEYSHEELER
ncbi:cingulin-like isoform X2 [Salvia hispanica]|nr:cingulin-like isoform X2 [Salvia hispanica]